MNKLLTLILLSAATTAFAANPYVGASVGYLVDSEEPIFAVRLGTDVAQVKGLTHSLEVEVSLVTETESGVTIDLVPAMMNYRFSGPISQGRSNFYFGGGAGFSRLKAHGFGVKVSDWSFSFQAFAGIEHKLSPALTFVVGARYIWIDDFEISGTHIEAGDDVALEVGLRYQF